MATKLNSNQKQFQKYTLNCSAVLLMQYLGISIRGLCSILGTLGIRFSVGNCADWKIIESIVGEAEKIDADKVSLENIKLETEKSVE
jgi:hypothetical protein